MHGSIIPYIQCVANSMRAHATASAIDKFAGLNFTVKFDAASVRCARHCMADQATNQQHTQHDQSRRANTLGGRDWAATARG